MRAKIATHPFHWIGKEFKFSSFQNCSILQLGIFYTIMHGGILIVLGGVFWDDWTLFHADAGVILKLFHDLGAIFNLKGYLHVAILSIAGVWLYKVLTFILMFASGILLNFILKDNLFLTKNGRYFVVLLFLILPLNLARIALVDFPYTACYFIFFLAWFLMGRQRAISLFLFFLSFSTNSLLVFYIFPVLSYMYQNRSLAGIKPAYSFFLRNLDFFVLPFLFFFIKVKFFSPVGLYAGYNEGYDILGVPHAMHEQLLDLLNFRIDPYIFLLLFPLVLFFVHRKIDGADDFSENHRWAFGAFLVGIFATIVGAFPYWIIGIVPKFNDWESRNQLLLPLGVALVIVGFFSFFNKSIQKIGFAVAIAGSLAYGIVSYYAFFVDWNKQLAIMDFFERSSIVKNSSLVLINDTTIDINALHRQYRFYEWNGLLDAAYGNQSHFAIDPIDLGYYQRGGFDKFFLDRYKAGTHRRVAVPSAVLVEIEHSCSSPQPSVPGRSCVQDGPSGLAFSTTPIDVEKPPSYLSSLTPH